MLEYSRKTNGIIVIKGTRFPPNSLQQNVNVLNTYNAIFRTCEFKLHTYTWRVMRFPPNTPYSRQHSNYLISVLHSWNNNLRQIQKEFLYAISRLRQQSVSSFLFFSKKKKKAFRKKIKFYCFISWTMLTKHLSQFVGGSVHYEESCLEFLLATFMYDPQLFCNFKLSQSRRFFPSTFLCTLYCIRDRTKQEANKRFCEEQSHFIHHPNPKTERRGELIRTHASYSGRKWFEFRPGHGVSRFPFLRAVAEPLLCTHNHSAYQVETDH
jgi:hypothetical protein